MSVMEEAATPPAGTLRNRKPLLQRQKRPAGTQPEVPDHEIIRIIGTGAYGEVWLARSVTGAYRAVKVVWREDFEDERLFTREFEGILSYEPVARGIPSLVHILHVGRNDGKRPYYFYVMELSDDAYTGIHIEPEDYVPRTLQSDMQIYGMHPMPLDYVLEIGSQLAHALVGLHAEELTHRDVKPSNVVFVNSRAKLADIGLVGHGSKRSFVGTEGYIPPDGLGTPRADVYALAKVLYEMSTGRDRLDFPELPDRLPEGTSMRLWQDFNNIICAAAEPKISRNAITSAAELAERLDALRCYAPGNRNAQVRRRHPYLRRCLMGTAAFVFVLAVGGHFLPQNLKQRLVLAGRALAGIPAETPPSPAPAAEKEPDTTPGSGRFFIATVPSGASVYTEDGQYLDETPYGPLSLPAGRQVSFILRKEGYADTQVHGIVPENSILSLGGPLRPYTPPRAGSPWTDTQGTVYEPDGDSHRATQAVTVRQFEEFLNSSRPASPIRYEKIPGTEYVRTTQEGISAFALWLMRRCETDGTIGRDHTLSPIPEPDTASGEDMSGFRMCAAAMQKTPINVFSNPAGASVLFNGQLLGVTPMQGVRVPISPYLLEIRLPGYSSVRTSGLTPKDLSLNISLRANNSVSFGTEWANSRGLRFIPISPSLMAGATEVRVSDYKAFCNATGTPLPESPGFEQNEHHPVVFVSRRDAEAFAHWLTRTERSNSLIEPTDSYRLPTDEEWSAMAGIKGERGDSPYERQMHSAAETKRDFPWGLRWPPYSDTGNFADQSAGGVLRANHIIAHYRDGFAFTSPVGSFAANMLGLNDMDGNVQEWVSGKYGGPSDFAFRDYGITRGGDYTSFRPAQLYTTTRTPRPIDDKRPTVGFRLMLERENHSL